ncbi:MAG TPA: nucleotide disphospho-sugar-binding domain-containing protein [Solirubrobacteraceae bacterium]|nr:nucleotide disphospho-sugar-binding domain-containing protein [Solirubrobacteraceae bacterium]
MLALGEVLARRGHEVTLQTWERWRAPVQAAGMRFAPAPEYHVFPTRERPLKPYEAVVRAARVLEPELATLAPDAIVADILTLAPALAGERAGVPVATLIPHVDPRLPPGAPPYSLGARWPRTAAGRSLWRAADRVVRRGLEQGRTELNETRRRLGLPTHDHVHNGISRELSVVGTFPQLEYTFPRPPGSHVVGPLLWEPPCEDVEFPPGDGPLVLVAPSTAQDTGHRLLRAALAGLADEPVRVLATWNRRPPDPPLDPVPANARVVDWLSYARTMPRCDLVVCHGGHGTVVRALASGCPVVIAPAAGDMNENAARVAWAGAGVRLPRRLVTPTTVRLAVVRALGDPSITARARELAAWAAAHDGAQRAAELVEAFAVPSGERQVYLDST